MNIDALHDDVEKLLKENHDTSLAEQLAKAIAGEPLSKDHLRFLTSIHTDLVKLACAKSVNETIVATAQQHLFDDDIMSA